MNESIGLGLMLMGLAFNLLGAIGLVRFSNFYIKIQTALKCVAFGTSLILFGSFVFTPASSEGIKSLLCMALMLMTIPVLSHAMSRAGYIYGVKLPHDVAHDPLRGKLNKKDKQANA